MKRIIFILLTAFLFTFLVISVDAAPKVKTVYAEITIVSVVGDTMYYTIQWKNIPKDSPVDCWKMRFYAADGSVLIDLNDAGYPPRPKTKYSSKVLTYSHPNLNGATYFRVCCWLTSNGTFLNSIGGYCEDIYDGN